jgi:DNA-binding CsgD family transcriptional regulator
MERLSKREKEVVQLLLQGKSNKQIALALRITIRTVEFHLKNIYDKFQVGSRTELILNLGESTVADQRKNNENEDILNLRNWGKFIREAATNFGGKIKMSNQLEADTTAGETSMTFFDAIRICFSKYAEFKGLASRPEFWWFALFVTLVASALTLIDEVVASIFLIAVLLPLLAVGTRRLRDSGYSGWWQLFLLAPVAGIIVLGFLWASPPKEPQEEQIAS